MERSVGSRITPHQTGFTLLELLIAMTLLSVIMLLVFGSLRIAMRSWEAGEKTAEKMSHIVIVETFLRSHLTRVKPWVDDFSDDEPVFSFQGTEHALLFVSTLPLHNRGQGGWHKFNLHVTEKDGQKDLIIALEPFFPPFNGESEAKIDDVVLIENVEIIEFSYFGSDELDEDPEWFETWEDKTYLPRMIRLDIQVRGDKSWPSLLVAPKMTPTVDSSL